MVSFARSSRLLALAVAALALAVPLARSQDEDAADVRDLQRGPAVTVAADGAAAVEITLAPTAGAAKLLADWAVGSEKMRETAPFEPVPGTKKRRAKLPATVPPSTLVTYEVLAGNDSLAKGELKTLPARGAKPFTFCALGDSGWPSRGAETPTKDQTAVARLLAKLDPDVAIHTGDIIYLTGQESGITPLFFEPYAKTLARVPFFCALGNHDVKTGNGAPALAAYPYPPNANKNRYYSFDVGNAHFVCLDSNEPMNTDEPGEFARSAQGKWLASDLAASTADWKIAFFHHPLYSGFPKRAHEQDLMRAACEKIFVEGGVDLCVTGHDHFYHRTPRVLAGKKDERGIVHVLTGGAGAALYPPEPGELTAAHAHRYHLVRFQVSGASIKLEALAPGKDEPEVIDSTEIVSKRRREPD